VNEPVVQTAPPEAKPPAARKEHHAGFGSALQWLLSVVIIAAFVMTFIVQAFEIPSESMENTLLIGDYLLVDKIDYARGGFFSPLLPYTKINRGDIVVFRYPVHPSQHFVKRVIGVPGDRVRLINKRVFVNGQPLIEPYTVYHSPMRNFYRDDFPNMRYMDGNVDQHWWLQMRKLIEDDALIVPEGNYFVMGDNRDESLDSRYWGFVPRENIVGRPLLIYWSVKRDPDDDFATDTNARMKRLVREVSGLFHDIRWDRTMKVVR